MNKARKKYKSFHFLFQTVHLFFPPPVNRQCKYEVYKNYNK